MNWSGDTTAAVLDHAADRFGDDLAIVDGHTRMTFHDVRVAASTTARAFIGIGVVPGDRIAVWLPNTHHWVVSALATHLAHAQLVPINTRYKATEAVEILERTRSRVLVVSESFLGVDRVEQLGPYELPDLHTIVMVDVDGSPRVKRGSRRPVVRWDDLRDLTHSTTADELQQRSRSITGDDVSDILFTSGTTGRSKGALSAHRQTVSVARVWSERTGLRRGDRYLAVNPFFHSFGYKAGILAALCVGATLYPMAVYDPATALATIARESISVFPGAPTIYRTILDHPDRTLYDISSLRLAVTGAAVVPVSLLQEMRRHLGIEIILTAYGLTESVVATMCTPSDDDHTVSSTSGRPVSGCEVKIGENSEILLRGPNIMLGYLDDPTSTVAAIDGDGWLHTGDVGFVDERGYLTVTDRLKDMYIAGGFNVYPAEVEQILTACDGVADAAVVGTPDARLGEIGVAIVVPTPGRVLDTSVLIEHCRRSLANFKVPGSIEVRPELPRNAGGKVLKHVLREEFR